MYRRLLLAACLLALSACASDDPGQPKKLKPGDPGWGGRMVPGERLAAVRLFVSPSGEAFRGEDGLGHGLAQADTDHDGSVSPAEFRADALRAFKTFDTNGDGVIDGIELQHYEHDVVPEVATDSFDTGPTAGRGAGGGRGGGRRGGHGGGGGGMGGGGMGGSGGGGRGGGFGPDLSQQPTETRVPGAGLMGAARYSLLNEPEPISAADTDLDGKVTLAEWMAITDRRFAKLDHTKIGKLTRDSLLHPPPKPKDAKAP
jgi:hypothetical protein